MAKIIIIFALIFYSCKPCEKGIVKQNLPNSLFTGGNDVHHRIISDSGLSCKYNHYSLSKWEAKKFEECKTIELESRYFNFNSIYLNGAIELKYGELDSVIISFYADSGRVLRYCLSHNTSITGMVKDGKGKIISTLDSKISLDTIKNFNSLPILIRFTVTKYGFIPQNNTIKAYYIDPSYGLAYAKTNDNILWNLFH